MQYNACDTERYYVLTIRASFLLWINLSVGTFNERKIKKCFVINNQVSFSSCYYFVDIDYYVSQYDWFST